MASECFSFHLGTQFYFSLGKKVLKGNSYQTLNISFPFAQLLTVELLKKKKNPFDCLVRFHQEKQLTFLAVLTSPLDTTSSPKRVREMLPAQGPEWLPKVIKKKKKKKYLDNPRELATVGRTLPANEVQPTFLSSHIWGPPTRKMPSKALRTHSETNKKAITVPGRERIDNQCFPPANLNLEGKGHEIPLSSPNQASEIVASCLWQEFLTFPGFYQLSQDPVCRLGRKWGVPAGLTLAPKSWGHTLDPFLLKLEAGQSWTQSGFEVRASPTLAISKKKCSKLETQKLWSRIQDVRRAHSSAQKQGENPGLRAAPGTYPRLRVAPQVGGGLPQFPLLTQELVKDRQRLFKNFKSLFAQKSIKSGSAKPEAVRRTPKETNLNGERYLHR